MSLPANKNYGPFNHNRQLSNLPNQHSPVQVSAGFRDVGTKPQLSTTAFSRIATTLFWTLYCIFYASAESTTAQSANPANKKSSLQKPLSRLPTSQIPSFCSTANKPLTLTAELAVLSQE